METVKQLTLVYTGVILINLALSAALWMRYRTSHHKGLFLIWASAVVAGVAQGAILPGWLGMAFVLLPSVFVGVSLAAVIGRVAGLNLRIRLYSFVVVLATAVSAVIYALGGSFWATTLPISISIAFPMVETPIRAFLNKEARLTMPAKAMALSSLLYGAHNLDYPFLRDKPEFASLGFSLALLAIFAVSITAPAVVLERVTEERTKSETLIRFQREFFANITHELRTPLTMILAPLESVLAGDFGPLTATQRSYLEANHRNALRLLKLINDLLDLAKMEEGFLRLRPEKSDLRVLLDDVVTYARPLAARKNLKIELEVVNAPRDLYVDLEKLERVLVNLISNALKFTSAGGVTVTVDARDGMVELSVVDTGIGIPPSAISHIFKRFSQGDGSTTRKYGGTGIGLAYAKEIVELHGGRITVESTPNVGSRFVVHLPEGPDRIPESARDRRSTTEGSEQAGLKRQEDQEPREWAQRLQRLDEYRFAEIGEVTDRRLVSRGSSGPASARILLVEDNPEILELVNLQLRDKYAIYAAQNGRLGFELAQKERPDLIITDFMMPEMDGLAMLQALRAEKHFAETPVIMLTSKNHVDDRLAARQAGADIYLAKPFSPRELQASVARLLEKRGHHVNNLIRAHAEGLEIVSAGLAHEIQNPLNFIKGAQLLIGEQVSKIREQVAGAALTDKARVSAIDRSNQKIDRMIESATRGVSRIEGVVALLRRYAREGYPHDPSDVVLDSAVRDVTELVAPKGDVECAVELEPGCDKKTVRCIPEELNQIILGLVQNAMEALGGAGTIKVRTREEGKNLVLEVSDNGPGISPDSIAKIFSPFFTTKTGTGRGLGLAVIQTIVSKTGGSVEVTSIPHTETTFRIRLPSSDGTQPEPTTRPSAQPTSISDADARS